jgi:hypothetical protein
MLKVNTAAKIYTMRNTVSAINIWIYINMSMFSSLYKSDFTYSPSYIYVAMILIYIISLNLTAGLLYVWCISSYMDRH